MVAKKLSISERLLGKIEKIPFSGCWIWMGGSLSKGYGVFKVKDKNQYVHRLSYIIHKGEIPNGLMVCHTCDIPLCVNPEHLFLGTAMDNNRDKVKKGRNPKGESGANAKLKQKDVDSIRSLHKKGSREFGSCALARKFYISQKLAWMIINNKRWKE